MIAWKVLANHILAIVHRLLNYHDIEFSTASPLGPTLTIERISRCTADDKKLPHFHNFDLIWTTIHQNVQGRATIKNLPLRILSDLLYQLSRYQDVPHMTKIFPISTIFDLIWTTIHKNVQGRATI